MLNKFSMGVALACLVSGCASPDSEIVFLASSGGVGGSGGAATSSGSKSSSGTGGEAGVGGFEPIACDGSECQLDNAFAICLNDECVIQECLNGFEDCNGNPADGCEVSTATDTLSCGSCTNQCYTEGATAVCSGGSCGCLLDEANKCSCDEGLGDCDTSRENGCESDLTSEATCGTCGVECQGSSKCLGGSCQCAAFNPPHDVGGSCGACLEKNCCSEMDACQNDASCMTLYNIWHSCQTDGQNCYWQCGTTNQNFVNLYTCQLNNSCNCGYKC